MVVDFFCTEGAAELQEGGGVVLRGVGLLILGGRGGEGVGSLDVKKSPDFRSPEIGKTFKLKTTLFMTFILFLHNLNIYLLN